MSINVELSHVTLLVPSLEKSLGMIPDELYHKWPLDVFSGSRETYIGPETYTKGMLLLIEGTDTNWFANFAKRFGYGLHHVAINVPSIAEYCESLDDTEWFLHRDSAWGMSLNSRVVYLVRPGLPLIIEVQQTASGNTLGEHFVDRIVVGVSDSTAAQAIQNLRISELEPEVGAHSSIRIHDRLWDVDNIVNMHNLTNVIESIS